MDDGSNGPAVEKKHDRANVRERIDWLIEQVAKGNVQRSSLLQLFTKKYGLSVGQFDKDFRQCKDEIKDFQKGKRKELIGRAVLRFEYLYGKNLKIQDYREARQVQAEINKILGLYIEKGQVMHTGEITITRKIIGGSDGKH